MFRLIGRLFRWSLIGGLLVSGLVVLLGATRVKTAFWSVRDHLRANVDELVDTRVALEHEIRLLEEEYPRRIAELRCQGKAIDRDLARCRRDAEICEEVTAICGEDLKGLREALEAAKPRSRGIVFRGERLTRAEALARADRIAQTLAVYRDRLAELREESKMLETERTRLAVLLADLQKEREAFRAEAGSLHREIDSLERKERLVEIEELRRRLRRDLLADRGESLAAVKAKIEERRIRLEEKLRTLSREESPGGYEARARVRLASR